MLSIRYIWHIGTLGISWLGYYKLFLFYYNILNLYKFDIYFFDLTD